MAPGAPEAPPGVPPGSPSRCGPPRGASSPGPPRLAASGPPPPPVGEDSRGVRGGERPGGVAVRVYTQGTFIYRLFKLVDAINALMGSVSVGVRGSVRVSGLGLDFYLGFNLRVNPNPIK